MYFNARYYDAEIGRFVSADSEVPNPKLSQSFNRYMFVAGNPISFVDADGHKGGSGGFKGLIGKFSDFCKDKGNSIGRVFSGKGGAVWDNIKHDVSDKVHDKGWWKDLGVTALTAIAVTLLVIGTIATAGGLAAVYGSIGLASSMALTASWATVGGVAGFFIGGTKGGILTDSDYFTSTSAWKDWDWKWAAAGFVIGAAVGAGGQIVSSNQYFIELGKELKSVGLPGMDKLNQRFVFGRYGVNFGPLDIRTPVSWSTGVSNFLTKCGVLQGSYWFYSGAYGVYWNYTDKGEVGDPQEDDHKAKPGDPYVMP